jgi:hypothetical protein
MTGYIQTTDRIKDIKKYHIKSFNILSKDLTKPIFIVNNNIITFTSLNNFVYKIKNPKKNNLIDNDDYFKNYMRYYNEFDGYRPIYKTSYIQQHFTRGSIINYAVIHNNFQILNWYYKSGFCFKKYSKSIYNTINIKIILILLKKINIKKCVKNFKHQIIKTIKFKTKNNYIKGYNKN